MQLDETASNWFVTVAERGNRASALRACTNSNTVQALIDGRAYFDRLAAALDDTVAGDTVYFVDFRGDIDERLGSTDRSVGEVLRGCARRGVHVFGLIWRSQPGFLDQSEGENAEMAREISDAGGEVLLDARTRRGGSHHQKFVVIRHPARPEADVAFAGGIDLGASRNDDPGHAGDPQVMDFPDAYGPRPPWHDAQVMLTGPVVSDIEHTFRERWDGNSALDIPSPVRMLLDRAYHAGRMTGRDLPPPGDDPAPTGPHVVQVLRTYPARWRRYPFAPLGERGIAAAYRKALGRVRRLIYLEDQYLWAPFVADLFAEELRAKPDLHLVAVVPRHPDKEGLGKMPSIVGRERAIEVCRAAGGERFAIYDLENESGVPVYVHAKIVIMDDTWAMIGSDNLNRRSWTHDSELSCAVLDTTHDDREPRDPGGIGDGARVFARDLRLRLWTEHLARDADDVADLIDPAKGFVAMRDSAAALQAWYDGGCVGDRPRGRLRPHDPERLPRRHRPWAVPVFHHTYDPDGRALRDQLRRRP